MARVSGTQRAEFGAEADFLAVRAEQGDLPEIRCGAGAAGGAHRNFDYRVLSSIQFLKDGAERRGLKSHPERWTVTGARAAVRSR